MENGSVEKARAGNQMTQCVNKEQLSLTSLNVSDPFTVEKLVEDFDDRYGSVTPEFKAIRARNMSIFDQIRSSYSLNPNPVGVSPEIVKDKNAVLPMNQIIVIDSDDEVDPKCEAEHNQLSQITQKHESANTIVESCAVANIWQPAIQYQKVSLTNIAESNLPSDLVDENCEAVFFSLKNLGTRKAHRVRKSSLQISNSTVNVDNSNEMMNKKLKKSFPNEGDENQYLKITTGKELFAIKGLPVDEDMGQDSPTLELRSDFDAEISENDGLEDLWNEMSLAMECSKSVSVDFPVSVKRVEEQECDCDHSFVLKDDMGLVCRICGIIQKGIEEIIDYQWSKPSRTTRTYAHSESKNQRNADISFSFSGLKPQEHDLLLAEIAIHPRHQKIMRPHQLEGFNFLVRNLLSEKPGGCILAHAPGSGKTFMLISFIQSFFGKFPFSRPLIILPKGILSTWKKEFKKWQVEEIPLFDLYSVKAEGRSKQFDVLKSWEEKKSILFMGYKQFANIVCDDSETGAAYACKEYLLKTPSLLIIDEGHTTRNDSTDFFNSLIRVETPRKVILSGTLFQNHVREVFNILNLVRPNFLKMKAACAVFRRIISRVQISGARKQCRIKPTVFYDLVEETLQDDENLKRKVAIIKDLREMTEEVLHYYKGDFLEELPGLVDFTVVLDLTPKQKAIYGKLGKMYKFRQSSLCSSIYMHPQLKNIAENNGGDKVNVQDKKIDDIIKGSFDVKDGVKTNFFLNILSLSESAGERLLVFSHYLTPLRFLERLLSIKYGWRLGKEMFMISGDSSFEQRELAMEQINNSDDAKVLFGSIKACGEGISLVGASRVIILDVHLNPSVSLQAIGRAFRPGQTKKVYVYRLVASDSIEMEDHKTSFNKELMSKLWFEWNQFRGNINPELETIDVKNSGDIFFENSNLVEDIKCLYKR